MERKVLEISLPKTGKKVKKHEKLSIHESDVQGEESRGEENQKKLKNQPKEQEKTSSHEFKLTSNEVKQLIEETLSKYLSSFSLQSTPHGPIPILSGGQLSFPLQTYYHQPPSQIPPPSQKKKIKNIKSSSSSQTPEISTDGPPPLSTIKSSEFINLKESFSLFQEEMKLKTIQYETNITSLKHVIDELQRSIIIKNDKWEDDFKKFQVSTEEKLHLSQQKMNKLIQKVYSKHETEVYDIRKELGELQEITSISNYNMKEDMHKLSKQISKSKEQLDSL